MVLELLRNDPLMDIEMRNPVSIHGRRHFYRDEPGPVLTAMMLSPPGQGRRGRPRLAFMVAPDGASVLQTSSPSPRLNGGCVAGNEGSGHIESNHGGMRLGSPPPGTTRMGHGHRIWSYAVSICRQGPSPHARSVFQRALSRNLECM